MAIFTKQQFESIARIKAGSRGLSATLNESRTFSKTSSTTSIFLSHSHTDRAIVEQAKVFFQNLGISIYVDWADETMPEKTTGVTATKIKSKMGLLPIEWVKMSENCFELDIRQHAGQDFESKIFFVS